MASSRAVILPYKMGSVSAKKLANRCTELLGLKIRRVKHDGKYRPKSRSLVINYGSSIRPGWLLQTRTLNDPSRAGVAGSKLSAFRAFTEHNVRTPEWTTDINQARQWATDGSTIVCRTILNGHSGRGIVLASTPEAVVPCQLYVKYKKKKKEFRVHVFNGRVIDVAEKRKIAKERRPDQFDGYIRNHSNGWIFARENIVKPDDLDSISIAAVGALGLDFGAVDVIWNERDNACYVLEVNTAPGLEGTTLENYARAITNWIRGQA